MSVEKKETWLNYMAMTTVFLALFATLSTFKGGGFSTKAVLNQSRASDQWSFFQAKSIKGYLYELQRDEIKLELKKDGKELNPALLNEYQVRIAKYEAKLADYEKEKAKIKSDAEGLEKARDEFLAHSSAFGMAVIFLQLAILLSSIAALLKEKRLWWVGLILGAVGAVYFANGFWLFF